MAHWAKIENGIVVQVNVVEDDFIQANPDRYTGQWVKTSYNGNIRKNYAGIGYTYDAVRDAFIPQKPYDSWLLNEDTCQWESPTPYPTDGLFYQWDEEQQNWKEITNDN